MFLVDKQGILLDDDDNLSIAQKPFAHPASDWKLSKDERKDLKAIISKIKPHVLIGTSTQAGAFTEEAIREMAKHVDHPIIFPLSNPTRLHEAKPEDLIKWTDGKGFVATGSPFPPVKHNGKTYEIAECNNSVCFPGVGLGCVLGKTKLLSDEMLVAAVSALADETPAVKQNDPTKALCPGVEQARDVSVKIAMAVLKQAGKENLLSVDNVPVDDDKGLEQWVRAQMWEPAYRDLVFDQRARKAKNDL